MNTLPKILKQDAGNPRSSQLFIYHDFGTANEHREVFRKNYAINLGYTYSNGVFITDYHFTDRRDLRRQAIKEYATYIGEYYCDFAGWNANQMECGGIPHRTQRDAIRTIEKDYLRSLLHHNFPNEPA